MKKTYAETRFFQWVESDTSVTIRSSGASYGGGSEVLVVDTLVFNDTQITSPTNGNVPVWGVCCHTLSATDRPPVVIIKETDMTYQNVTGPLMANSHPGSYCGQDAYSDMLITGGNEMNHSTVRRLTPLECERLQGYPDGWTLIGEPKEVEVKDYITIQVPGDNCPYTSEAEAFEAWCGVVDCDDEGNPVSDFDLKDFGFVEKKIPTGSHKEIQYFYRDSDGKKKRCADSARYKALGNSVALPFWKVLAKRISAQYDRDITMGSLFDGIGGFPLVFEQINGKGTARWASEIEEFPMAVTKLRFGED